MFRKERVSSAERFAMVMFPMRGSPRSDCVTRRDWSGQQFAEPFRPAIRIGILISGRVKRICVNGDVVTRRDLLRISSAASAGFPRAAAAGPAKPPNFLFLIADDLTYRGIHALGNSEIQTPNLDRLVRRGCTFTHCFHQGSWSGAVCVPSRTMLNTGLSAFHAR